MTFKYLEEIALADIAFEAVGKNLEELFVSCAEALEDSMVNLKDVKNTIVKDVKLEEDNTENLLFKFLNELIFLKDVEGLLFSKFNVKIKQNKKYVLSAKLAGEKINHKRHELRNDVKAVTMHLFEIKQIGKNFKATVVLDI